jgi:hypothetical protein
MSDSVFSGLSPDRLSTWFEVEDDFGALLIRLTIEAAELLPAPALLGDHNGALPRLRLLLSPRHDDCTRSLPAKNSAQRNTITTHPNPTQTRKFTMTCTYRWCCRKRT